MIVTDSRTYNTISFLLFLRCQHFMRAVQQHSPSIYSVFSDFLSFIFLLCISFLLCDICVIPVLILAFLLGIFFLNFMFITFFGVGRVAQSVERLTMGWTVRDRIPVGTGFSALPYRP